MRRTDLASDSQSVKLPAAICSEHEESTSVANTTGSAPESRQSDDCDIFQVIMSPLAGEKESVSSSNTPVIRGFPGAYPGFPEKDVMGFVFVIILLGMIER